MIAEQAELNLREKAARAVNCDSVEEFCQLLRGRAWIASKGIQQLRPDWTDRFIRQLASASAGRVISYPGSPGYRLTQELPEAELPTLDHAASALIHQGRDMMRRGVVFRRLAALQRAAQILLSLKP